MTAFFPPEEFAARRSRIFDAIGHSHAVLQGAGPVRGFEYPRQSNEFFYLTGLPSPQAYLLLDGAQRTAAIYLPHRDPHGDDDGPTADEPEDVKRLTGVDSVYHVDRLAEHLASATALYVPHAPTEGKWECRDVLRGFAKRIAPDPWELQTTRDAEFQRLLRDRCPQAELRDLTPILDPMRLIKSPREVDLMRQTGRLSALAVAEAMRSTQAGVYEYQLGAIADYIFRVNGARAEGYRAIIATGANIWHIHYYQNNCALHDGDLVLMDYAPDLHNYTNDVGRMWPVNGVYSPLQRELYGFIVEYHKAVLRHLRPGVLPQQVLDEAAEEMRPVVDQTAFSKPIYEAAARRTLDFKGHLSHPVGMAVHDVGAYFAQPLEPGLVISIDPQMWIPEEKLYIRVEDTIVITETGMEVLTVEAPLELNDVEALMRESGMIQNYPPLA